LALYVVVHHRQDPRQPWETNGWSDDDLLASIPTTVDVATECRDARNTGQWVYVHRCAWDGGPASICCRVHVVREHVDRSGSFVVFSDAERLGLPAWYRPKRGENCYHAPEPREMSAGSQHV
jgi:hypothetical protein